MDSYKDWVSGCYHGSRFFIEFSIRKQIPKKQAKELIEFCSDFKNKLDAASKLKP